MRKLFAVSLVLLALLVPLKQVAAQELTEAERQKLIDEGIKPEYIDWRYGEGGNTFVGEDSDVVSGSLLNGTFMLGVFANITNSVVKIDPFNVATITSQTAGVGQAITAANRFILNLANLFFVLILLLIAISTIFGVEAYGVGRLLPKLIIAILLSNFGLFFVRFITSTAQILQVSLLTGANDKNIASVFIESAGAVENLARWGTRVVLGITSWFTGGLTVPLQFLFEAVQPVNWFTVAFLLIALVLVLRIVGLWVLAIFAPIGVVLGVLPSTAGLAKKYWRKVVTYAFVGPIMIFFMRLALAVWDAFNKSDVIDDLALQKVETGYTSNTFFQALLTAVVLFVGLMITKKLGVEVANFSIGVFQKAFKGAWTAATLLGGGGIKAVGSLLGGGKFAQSVGMSLASRAGRMTEQGQRIRGAQYASLANVFGKLRGKKKDGFWAGAATVFETASEPLVEGRKGTAKVFRAVGLSRGAARAWEQLQREDPSLIDEVRANPQAFADRITRETDPNRREGLILGAIEEGKVVSNYSVARGINDTNSIRWRDIERWIRPGNVATLQGQAALRDPRLSAAFRQQTTEAGRNDVLRRQLASQDVSQLNKASLGDARIAQALFDVRKVDLPRFFKQWSDTQNKAFGQGLSSALDSIGDTIADDRRWRDVARTAIEKGVDPSRVFSDARMNRNDARRRLVRDTVLKDAAGRPSMYRLQTPDGALNLAGNDNLRVDDMAKVLKALPKQISQAFKRAAKDRLDNDAGPLSRSQALAALGNIGAQINNP